MKKFRLCIVLLAALGLLWSLTVEGSSPPAGASSLVAASSREDETTEILKEYKKNLPGTYDLKGYFSGTSRDGKPDYMGTVRIWEAGEQLQMEWSWDRGGAKGVGMLYLAEYRQGGEPSVIFSAGTLGRDNNVGVVIYRCTRTKGEAAPVTLEGEWTSAGLSGYEKLSRQASGGGGGTPGRAAGKTPEQVVDSCYAWYFKEMAPVSEKDMRPRGNFIKTFSQVKDYFQPDYYSMLSIAQGKVLSLSDRLSAHWDNKSKMSQKEVSEAEQLRIELVDVFNPFNYGQGGTYSHVTGKAEISGDKATVPVTLTVGVTRRGKTVVSVVLTKKEGAWRISDFLKRYEPAGKAYSNYSSLKELLEKKKMI